MNESLSAAQFGFQPEPGNNSAGNSAGPSRPSGNNTVGMISKVAEGAAERLLPDALEALAL